MTRWIPLTRDRGEVMSLKQITSHLYYAHQLHSVGLLSPHLTMVLLAKGNARTFVSSTDNVLYFCGFLCFHKNFISQT